MTTQPKPASQTPRVLLLLLVIGITGWLLWPYRPMSPTPWSTESEAILQSLRIDQLGPPPTDKSNSVADSPAAVLLGNRVFFDTRFSANGEVSCASCHQPEKHFTDGLQKGRGIGESGRNTRSIVGVAYSPWLYWDGRRDSLWAQALSPLEDPNEHGSNRMRIVRLVADEAAYRAMYEPLFGPTPEFANRERFPDDAAPGINQMLDNAWQAMSAADRNAVNRMYANIGKAVAAYERTLQPEPTRFDRYVAAVLDDQDDIAETYFSAEEVMGLQLFIGKARCTECHNGPLFTNHEFHNTGVLSFPGDLPDRGRVDGARLVSADPFNCRGKFSDDPERACAELHFMRTGTELIGATRTPSLRNLFDTAPYMHKGQINTLKEVIEHYDSALDAMIGHNEAEPLALSRREKKQLLAFLNTLSPEDPPQ